MFAYDLCPNHIFKFNDHSSKIDLFIIATPLKFYQEIFNKISQHLHSNTLIVDIGSLKSFIFEFAPDILGQNIKNFVACHPIAGSEKSGITNYNAGLLSDKKLIITPDGLTDKLAIQKATSFWENIGCHIQYLTPKDHDRIYALVSHLPQLISFMTKEKFDGSKNTLLNKHFRLQDSNPEIWNDIFLINKENIKNYLDEFLNNINSLIQNLKAKKCGEITYFLIENHINDPQKDDFLKRILMIECFLNIKDVKESLEMSGSGFFDFTFAFPAKNINHDVSADHKINVDKLIEKNQQSLLEFFYNLQNRVNNFISC
jgi:prephenate dehydrogenase